MRGCRAVLVSSHLVPAGFCLIDNWLKRLRDVGIKSPYRARITSGVQVVSIGMTFRSNSLPLDYVGCARDIEIISSFPDGFICSSFVARYRSVV